VFSIQRFDAGAPGVARRAGDVILCIGQALADAEQADGAARGAFTCTAV
jgi:hypothetical protein